MESKTTKWTIVTVLIILLAGIGTVASLSDRIVLTREYTPHLSEFKQHQQDTKDERRYIRHQLDEIKSLLLDK